MFAHDTEVALAAAAALVNTVSAERGAAARPRGARRLRPHLAVDRDRTRDEAELEAVRALRPRLRPTCGTRTRTRRSRSSTACSASARAMPQLVVTTAGVTTSMPRRRDAPLADRMAVEAAMAFSDVIRLTALDRLPRLRRPRLRGRRRGPLQEPRPAGSVTRTCGNRTNVAAYRARRRSAIPSEATASGVRRRRPPTRHGDR